MDKSRVELTISFIEKISFSLKLFSGHFYGQSFIKTVRGPLEGNISPKLQINTVGYRPILIHGVISLPEATSCDNVSPQ